MAEFCDVWFIILNLEFFHFFNSTLDLDVLLFKITVGSELLLKRSLMMEFLSNFL